MAMVSNLDPRAASALNTCVETLRGLAEYELDPDIDEYIRKLGERKEFLTPEEHEGLLAFVSLTQERLNEKLAAMIALKQLRAVFPELFNGQ